MLILSNFAEKSKPSYRHAFGVEESPDTKE